VFKTATKIHADNTLSTHKTMTGDAPEMYRRCDGGMPKPRIQQHETQKRCDGRVHRDTARATSLKTYATTVC
jgi:hypothetical protein